MSELQDEFLAALGMAGGRAADALAEFSNGPTGLELGWTTARPIGSRVPGEGEILSAVAFSGGLVGEARFVLAADVIPALLGASPPEGAAVEIAEVVLHAFIGVLANLAAAEVRILELRPEPTTPMPAKGHSIRLAAIREQGLRAEILVAFADEEGLRPLLATALRQFL